MDIEERMDKLTEKVTASAESAEFGAAFAGEFGDRGASRLKDQVKFFNYGRDGIVPPEWEKAYGHMLDEEWAEYIRLSNKFRGK